MAAYRERRVSAPAAQRRLGALRARFVAYETEIAAVRPVPAPLRDAHRAYAHTYVLEDNYLRTLLAAIPSRDFRSLPHTAEAQRAAIVAWRERLHAIAGCLEIPLPADIELAGRGEIAPSPLGD
jgi:hypothetical protein